MSDNGVSDEGGAEYRISSPHRDTTPTKDPQVAGERFRRARQFQIDGEKIKLQKRKLPPWETVEETK